MQQIEINIKIMIIKIKRNIIVKKMKILNMREKISNKLKSIRIDKVITIVTI